MLNPATLPPRQGSDVFDPFPSSARASKATDFFLPSPFPPSPLFLLPPSHPQCGLAKSMPMPGTSLSTESHTGSPWQRAQEETPRLPLQTHSFLNPVSAFVHLPCARPCSGQRDEAMNQSGEFPLFGDRHSSEEDGP